MSFDNTVSILFEGVNRVTPVVNDIMKDVNTMAPRRGLFGDAASTMLGNLASNTIGAGINTVSQGYQQISQGIMAATSAQTEFITTASGLANVLGAPMDKAKGLLESLQKDLSIAAAELPGENKDYIEVLNTLSDTIAREYRGDIDGFKTAVKDITIRTAALASTVKGLSGTEAGSTVERLANGATLQSLHRLDFLQKNQTVYNELESQIKAAGLEGNKWVKATTKQRLDIIQKALKATATDELFNNFKDTADSIMQSMKSKLFDMQTGIFGFLRRLDTRQDRNALDAWTEVLKRINNLGAAGSRLSKQLGLAFDPMAALIDVFDGLNNFLGNIVYQLDISATPDLGIQNVIGFIAEWGSDLIKNSFSAIRTMDTGWLAKGFDYITTFFEHLDWDAVGQLIGITIWKTFVVVIKALPRFLVLVDRVLAGLLTALDGVTKGIFKGIKDSLYNVFVRPVIEFLDKVRSWWDRLTSSLPNIGGAVQSVTAPVTGAFNAVTSGVGGAIDTAKKAASDPLGAVGKIGEKVFGKQQPATQSPPVNADKVNAPMRSTPIQPIAPTRTVQKTAMNNSTTNTIQGLTINASNAGSPLEIASVVIEELNRQLNYKVTQQLA